MTTVDTPFALIDIDRLDRNAARLRDHLSGLGVPLRLHVKTSKSVEVARRVHADGPITVSTLAEAEHFADAGYRDILYAVGIDPHKLPRVAALLRRGVTLTVLLDSLAQAEALTRFAAEENLRVPALIEIDCDGHRGGVAPADPALVHIGRSLGPHLAGVLTHAGESYFAYTPEALRQAAQNERDVAVAAAETLRANGLHCPIVSVGSTPTAHAATDLAGVTEVRAGNYVFFDLVMAGIGVCGVDDLALSVVVTVIGHRHDKNWVLTDGGWMATSRDRGTQVQAVDQSYGLVADEHGDLIPDLLMTGASQEHGVLSTRDGKPVPDLPIGTRLRILPNHACATAAQHDRYHVASGNSQTTWSRLRGW
ncbi:D-serine deaminase, pyridoxal phosphate-dependent [Lentzea waywayandensis]|uniref:D-serine deaminase, pyridoxal phosphate-dependent n=1 Tax=Lentzea waywayandensis TaxID=84724 RepID=A0A1I6DKT0_9PSEU|nr:DSD1 family PLP-dependent enzyme [Lentzea waywayandensis]SFR06050.1 D-serine deaminase, pyridoxal phosphate-dependent [Lentzea waywayandensis]